MSNNMTPKSKHKTKKSENAQGIHTPRLMKRDPSLPTTVPTTSKDGVSPSNQLAIISNDRVHKGKKWYKYIYDPELRLFCDRTCAGWFAILAYSVMYVIFLSTYTMIFLFSSLSLVKSMGGYLQVDKVELLTYSEQGIGLSAIPTSETSFPLIWYKNGVSADYEKYVNALDRLLESKRKKRNANNNTRLGPCGRYPYGYGEKPCVVIKINKQLKWSAKPLEPNSSLAATAPLAVQKWLRRDKRKFWLHCGGYHSYDKEHIGSIKYFPDPPGFDPEAFPLNATSDSPLVAIQISDFTLGISLAVQCTLWYESGPSTIEFVLYVAPTTYLRDFEN